VLTIAAEVEGANPERSAALARHSFPLATFQLHFARWWQALLLKMTFVSTHRPLSAYISAFVDSGLLLGGLREFGTKPIPWLLVARLERM
jgi:hypothetical protein